MLSFIIPFNSKRNDRLSNCIFNIQKFYVKDEHEIIAVQQKAEEPFKLGQVRNIGFKKSSGDIIIFLDVDMRFPEKILFKKELETFKTPFVAWKFITKVDEEKTDNFEILSEHHEGVGKGGCVVYSRKQFVESCGYSNLPIGWGKEDNIINIRKSLIRLNYEIYHVNHDNDRRLWGAKASALDFNTMLSRTEPSRMKHKDSFEHTIADEEIVFEGFEIKHYKVSNIRVPDDFVYTKLFNKSKEF